jgi:DNA-binding PucR family transcriptional regulator
LGVVAASEGRWLVGVTNGGRPVLAELELPKGSATAEADLTAREEIGPVLEELRMLVAVARDYGHGGPVKVSDYLPELLLRSAPRIAAQIRNRVYGPLRVHPELGQTLDALVEHAFNRGAAAAALPVHRNTLRDRLQRIGELTGIDLERTEDRGLAWLAYLYAPRRPERGG